MSMEKPNNPEQLLSLELDYTNPDGKKDLIRLNLEQKLAEFIDFYKNNNIDTPEDFENQIKEIWHLNYEEIKEDIQRYGFDEILLIPPTPDLDGLKEKTKMGNGYNIDYDFGGDSLSGAKSKDTDKTRLILIYRVKDLIDRKETKDTIGEQVYFYDNWPIDSNILTLEDYLIYAKKYYEETGDHLDELYIDGSYCWVATSIKNIYNKTDYMKVSWSSKDEELNIFENNLKKKDNHRGYRPCRSFYKDRYSKFIYKQVDKS